MLAFLSHFPNFIRSFARGSLFFGSVFTIQLLYIKTDIDILFLGVQSHIKMGRIAMKSVRVVGPRLYDELVRREAFERLQSPGKIVGAQERVQMLPQLPVIPIVITINRGLLDRGFIRSTCPLVQG